jgi:hypothetical protein
MDDTGQPAISTEELYTAAVGERAARYYLPKFPRRDGTITIRFTTLDGLRRGMVSFRPSFSSTGAVVWTCGYHTPAGVDAPNAAAGPDLTNIAPSLLLSDCGGSGTNAPS